MSSLEPGRGGLGVIIDIGVIIIPDGGQVTENSCLENLVVVLVGLEIININVLIVARDTGLVVLGVILADVHAVVGGELISSGLFLVLIEDDGTVGNRRNSCWRSSW